MFAFRLVMTSTAAALRARLERGDSIDVRGLGKAGGGLVLVIQAFAEAITAEPTLDVQDWPLFSSARKGANVTVYLRIAKGRVENTARIVAPDIAVLMNEAAGDEADFAEGVANGALFVANTERSAMAVARRYRLSGTVVAVPGDEIGRKHLGRPLGNVAVLAALVKGSGLVTVEQARESLEHRFEKRRLPARMIASNLAAFDEALERLDLVEIAPTAQTSHAGAVFKGYGQLPIGAQAALRTSSRNRTSGSGRPGVVVEFNDLSNKCNGCSLCVVQCPEGIIEFRPDPRGAIVTGARFEQSCKKCRECIAACPLELFREVAVVAPPEHALEGN